MSLIISRFLLKYGILETPANSKGQRSKGKGQRAKGKGQKSKGKTTQIQLMQFHIYRINHL